MFYYLYHIKMKLNMILGLYSHAFCISLVAQMVKCLQCGRPKFDPWVGKIPWRRKWQSTLGLVPGKSHGQRSLVGYSPWGRKESYTTEGNSFHSFIKVVITFLPRSKRLLISWLQSPSSVILKPPKNKVSHCFH